MTERTPDGNLWVRCYHPAPDSRVRLVCFAHAGGAASFFVPLSAALGPEVEVLSVQYPGRQDRRDEEPMDDLRALADQVFESLRPWFDHRLAFFGHSMGACVAFEVARRMEQEDGVAPSRLIASARRAPSRYVEERVHMLADEDMVGVLKRLGGTDAGVLDHPELVRMILPATRADYRAIETYVAEPGAKVGCPVTVFFGDRDPYVTVEEAEAWQEHTAEDFELHAFGGGHFYLTERQVEVVDRLAAVLQRDP